MRRSGWFVLPALALSVNWARADVLDKAPSRFARAGDLKVHHKSLGEGDTAVVFVHGWCCDHGVWRDQAAGLHGKARLLFLDLPGYGKSDRPKVDCTLGLFARGIDAVLRDAGVEHAVLVGHSMGTPVVRQYYRLYPGKTRALVFVDGALRPFTKDPAEVEKFMSRYKEDTFKDTAARAFAGMFTSATPKAARERVERTVAGTDPKVAISSLRGTLDPKAWKDDPVKVPALALMARSPFWNDDYKAFARKLVPGLEYREFDGVGYFLFMEKPKEFNAALVEFLKKQGVVK